MPFDYYQQVLDLRILGGILHSGTGEAGHMMMPVRQTLHVQDHC